MEDEEKSKGGIGMGAWVRRLMMEVRKVKS